MNKISEGVEYLVSWYNGELEPGVMERLQAHRLVVQRDIDGVRSRMDRLQQEMDTTTDLLRYKILTDEMKDAEACLAIAQRELRALPPPPVVDQRSKDE